MAQRIRGKVAILTGADSGICLSFTKRLLERGARVVLADTRLRTEATALVSKYASTAIFQKADVTRWSDLEQVFRVTKKKFGTIDIVCPGAGVFEPPQSSFWSPPGSAVSQDQLNGDRYMNIDVNLVHPIRMTQIAISHFLADPKRDSTDYHKSIVLVASIASETASLQFPLYHAAKHGLFGFPKSLASLESLGIKVTSVLPGMVKTPMWTEAREKMQMLTSPDGAQEEWIPTDDVARLMVACVEENATRSLQDIGGIDSPIVGGSCLEITPGSIRDVPMLNNPGPRFSEKDINVAIKAQSSIIDRLKAGWP
ncbi:Short chain dehydrogenase-like protein 65 [Elsinoe fawcettii]|nr:Short chain dehydrogenase-like protein 65 [Elsinoe fawcettii]